MKDNKRIAINTGIIYVKLILSTVIGLLCSRIVLHALGTDDYGLYTVVGGVVSFLNVMGTTMVSVSYRYIAIELGKENGDVNRIYNTVYTIHLFLAAGLLLIGETLGLYYINHILNVAPSQLHDAQIVFQVSLFTTIISVMSVPANGLIIAKEKFLFISLTEIGVTVLKLIMVIAMSYYIGDRLIVFSLIMAVVTIITRVCYWLYCRLHYASTIKWNLNRSFNQYKEIFAFALWSLFGALAIMGTAQGAAMIINVFFGTALNAAFGLANQVNRYITIFTNSLNQAAVPQIMKSYGGGDRARSLEIVYSISRLSTLILLILVIPIILNVDGILQIWLKEVPEYTNVFVVWMLINGFVTVLGSGFDPCIQSTGNIRNNEIGYGLINLALLPIIYILYKMGSPAYVNVIIMPFLTILTRVFQIFILKRQTEFNVKQYVRFSLVPSILTLIIAIIPLVLLRSHWGSGSFNTIMFVALSGLWTCFVVWIIGLNRREREQIIGFVKKKVNRASV